MTPPLLVLGNVNVDLVLGPVAGWPAIGTEIEVERAETRAGGSAGNTALALDGMDEPHLLIASTGDDPNGAFLRGEFREEWSDWIIDPGATTLTVGIVHEGGDRAFFTTPGHLQRADVKTLMERVPSAPREGAIAILSGGFLMPAICAETSSILAELKRRSWQTAIDPGWPPQGWNGTTLALMAGWLALADYALLNEEEMAALADTEASPLETMQADAVLVVKRGAAGVSATVAGAEISVPAPAVTVVDTVGAGDTFNAAFLAARVSGLALPDALTRGVAVASQAVSTYPRSYKGDLS